MKTPEDLTQLAIDVVSNQVFMTQTEEGVMNAFRLVLLLASDDLQQRMIDDNPQAFYEYLNKQLDRSVNGYPSFGSMQWLSEEEWKVFYPIYEQKRTALYDKAAQEAQ